VNSRSAFVVSLLASACTTSAFEPANRAVSDRTIAPVPAPSFVSEASTESGSSAHERALVLLEEARAAQSSGDDALALRHAADAVTLLRQVSEPAFDEEVCGIWIRSGLVAWRAGERALAQERWQYARGAIEFAAESQVGERARVRLDLASVAEESGEPDRAVTEAELALVDALRAFAETSTELQSARLRTAVFTGRRGDRARARVLQEEALAVLEKTLEPHDPLRLKADEDYAITLYSMGEVREAVRRLVNALAVRESGVGDASGLQVARRNTTAILLRAGDFVGARAIADAWVANLSGDCEAADPRLLDAQYHQGCVLRQLGEYDACARVLEDALGRAAGVLPVEDPLRQSIELELGSAWNALGRDEEGLVILEHVLEIRERTLRETDMRLLMARNTVAGARAEYGDILGARNLMQRALSRGEQYLQDQDPELQRSRQNLAVILFQLGDHAGGRALFEKALQVRASTLAPGHPSILLAQLHYAVALQREGENAAAGEWIEKILSSPTVLAPGQEMLHSSANIVLANVRLGQDDVDGARAAAQLALQIALSANPPLSNEITNARTVLAGALHAQGDFENARDLLEDVLESATRLPRLDTRRQIESALFDLMIVHTEAGDRERLEQCAARLLASLRDSLAGLKLDSPRAIGERCRVAAGLLDGVLNAVVRGSELEVSAFETLEVLRGLDSGADLRFGPIPVELQASVARIRALRRDLKSDRGRNSEPTRFERSVRERDELEAELRIELVERGLVPVDFEMAALSSVLAPDEAVVTIRRYGRSGEGQGDWRVKRVTPSFVAFVIAPEKGLRRVELGPAAPIEAAVEQWRAVGLDGGHAAARGLAKSELHAGAEQAAGLDVRLLVLDPILALLPTTRRLAVAADDVLHLVAFDALPLGDRLVGERIEVTSATSLARLVAPRVPAHADSRLLVVGGIDYDAIPSASVGSVSDETPRLVSFGLEHASRGGFAKWPPLTGAEAEARGVARQFTDSVGGSLALLTGDGATRSAVIAGLERARWVHLATHGWFAREGEEEPVDAGLPSGRPDSGSAVSSLAPLSLCGLALAGANAPPDEHGRVDGVLSAEELAGFDLSGCELAVLSACETSLGVVRGGRGIQSLQAALHAAGAHTAITSLWNVSDEATSELFQDFYQRVWRDGEPKARALWNAKMTLRARGRPLRDWAGWVLSGHSG